MWAAQYYHFEPGHFITSGGLGTMGFGFRRPSAPRWHPIKPGGGHRRGRQHPDEHPGNGHGGAVSNCRSRSSILNNGFLGMVRQWQELFYDKRYSSTKFDHTPDFVKLAEAYGAVGCVQPNPKR
jgi:acetolactate synthase I/II/III large subunit